MGLNLSQPVTRLLGPNPVPCPSPPGVTKTLMCGTLRKGTRGRRRAQAMLLLVRGYTIFRIGETRFGTPMHWRPAYFEHADGCDWETAKSCFTKVLRGAVPQMMKTVAEAMKVVMQKS